MPFYRSNFESAGGGGGGGSDVWGDAYVSFASDNNSIMENPPLMSLANNYIFGSLNSEDATAQLSEIKIGNRVNSVAGLFRNLSYFNCNINLYNAFNVNDFTSMTFGATRFNSNVIFPRLTIAPNRTSGSDIVNLNFGYMFANCFNYNQPINITIHAKPQPNCYLWSTCSGMFLNCYNFNSRINFDIYQYSNNMQDDTKYSLPVYASEMFWNCYNFNQPLIIPPGFSLYSAFWNCRNFNQPVVFDVRDSSGSEFERVFEGAKNMYADIIFLNSNIEMEYYPSFNGLISNMNRTIPTHIYIENIGLIKDNCNVISNVSSIIWEEVANGYYNSIYNVYLLNNVGDALNNFNNYYYNFYGEYPTY